MNLSNDAAYTLAQTLDKLLTRVIQQSGYTCRNTTYIYMIEDGGCWHGPMERPEEEDTILGVRVRTVLVGCANVDEWTKKQQDRVVGWLHKTNQVRGDIKLENRDRAVKLYVDKPLQSCTL